MPERCRRVTSWSPVVVLAATTLAGCGEPARLLAPGGPAAPPNAAAAGEVTVRDLGTLPGGDASIAYGINNSGQVVGWSRTASFRTHAFIAYAGHPELGMRDLGTLVGEVGDHSAAYAINDRGEVVGESSTAAGDFHALL